MPRSIVSSTWYVGPCDTEPIVPTTGGFTSTVWPTPWQRKTLLELPAPSSVQTQSFHCSPSSSSGGLMPEIVVLAKLAPTVTLVDANGNRAELNWHSVLEWPKQ